MCNIGTGASVYYLLESQLSPSGVWLTWYKKMIFFTWQNMYIFLKISKKRFAFTLHSRILTSMPKHWWFVISAFVTTVLKALFGDRYKSKYTQCVQRWASWLATLACTAEVQSIFHCIYFDFMCRLFNWTVQLANITVQQFEVLEWSAVYRVIFFTGTPPKSSK